MTRRLLFSTLLAATAFSQVCAALAATPSFPLIGAYLGGGANASVTPAQVAKVGVAVIGAWPGWTSSGGLTLQQFVAAAKAINPNVKIAVYTVINEFDSPIPSLYATRYGGVATVPWWLYQAGTSGSVVSSGYASRYEINVTTFSKVSGGQNYPTWRARQDNAQFLTSAPALDGIFIDNVFWKPRVDGDWRLSGSSQSQDSTQTQQDWRNGYVAYVNALRAAASSSQQLVFGNTADWGGGPITEYIGLLNGGLIQSIIGQSYSYESQGWSVMMAAYAKIMAASAAPAMQIFEYDNSNATDYQGMRYGLTACMVGGNGYYFFNTNNENSVSVYDEYSSNLGAATSPPQTAAYQNGVWRRDFQNGIALVNPKGNGTQTVTLDTSYKHLAGTQDPAVNNGQTVTSVTLNDRDGVILLSLTSQPAPAVPDPPKLTVQ